MPCPPESRAQEVLLHGAPAAELPARTDKIFISIADPEMEEYSSVAYGSGYSTRRDRNLLSFFAPATASPPPTSCRAIRQTAASFMGRIERLILF